MRRIALLALLACGRPSAEATVAPDPLPATTAAASTATVTSTSTSTATATAVATTTPKPTATVTTRCSAGQLNTPCVFQRGAECFVRRSNCTGMPCTESAPEPVDCSVFASAHPAGACDVVEKCRGVSDEGCQVTAGTCNPMRTCVKQSCESAILAATSCSAVQSSCIRQ